MTGYTTVKLPKDLIEQVDRVVANESFGYGSRAELVKEAVRNFLANPNRSRPVQ